MGPDTIPVDNHLCKGQYSELCNNIVYEKTAGNVSPTIKIQAQLDHIQHG